MKGGMIVQPNLELGSAYRDVRDALSSASPRVGRVLSVRLEQPRLQGDRASSWHRPGWSGTLREWTFSTGSRMTLR
jgi:hypothetical protein